MDNKSLVVQRNTVSRRSTILVFLFLAIQAVCASNLFAIDQPFRFTATVDSRSAREGFQHVLSQITSKVGDEGVFHICPGDIDPLTDNYNDLKNEFGDDIIWYPVVGNHEAETAVDMQWIRSFYPNLPYIVNPGPSGSETTTYSFDYQNAHFIVLNEYYNGTSDVGTNGNVVDALYSWLLDDLNTNTKSAIFVIGHEPAYPQFRHIGDSLDAYPTTRDRFWNLFEAKHVTAYICGHTHAFSKYQHGTGKVWQIDLGNAGMDPGDGKTFADIQVNSTTVTFNIWRGETGQEFTLAHSWTVNIDPDANRCPGVYAGYDQIIMLPQVSVNLDGSVADDGLPNGSLSYLWSVVTGPADGTAAFEDPSALTTTATFSEPGTYLLKLTADDSELSDSDTVSVTVFEREVEPGLVAKWSFEEGNGVVAVDTTGNGHDGNVVGAAWTDEGCLGKALEFDGGMDYVQFDEITINGAFAYSTWIKPDHLINNYFIGAGNDYYVRISSPGTLLLKFNALNYCFYLDDPLTIDEWHHVIFTRDMNNNMKFYINGELQADSHENIGSAKFGFIGTKREGAGFFDGSIDEVRLYDRELDQAEIVNLGK